MGEWFRGSRQAGMEQNDPEGGNAAKGVQKSVWGIAGVPNRR